MCIHFNSKTLPYKYLYIKHVTKFDFFFIIIGISSMRRKQIQKRKFFNCSFLIVWKFGVDRNSLKFVVEIVDYTLFLKTVC